MFSNAPTLGACVMTPTEDGYQPRASKPEDDEWPFAFLFGSLAKFFKMVFQAGIDENGNRVSASSAYMPEAIVYEKRETTATAETPVSAETPVNDETPVDDETPVNAETSAQ
mmetsp:Transcript_12036/g.20350  ORF Transcript_12036/g.20350 Transcript_12036/m.20350 type:complete len:112 (+) Transcript_12036:154-489(+)|eukprot:CAMPEP_0198211460 /NCGR_PEP_ID=MMETSP1445-20131203/23997_1 /TAXON_ID=36898 /ORGANISM="Pyramimonas sp., Strain CCMP2087" /LENGTH=111 /DNA_ID=CAMNT_0043885723 /DNA_START=130 /DNA_END=465 /DNA_ORIENTATION=-